MKIAFWLCIWLMKVVQNLSWNDIFSVFSYFSLSTLFSSQFSPYFLHHILMNMVLYHFYICIKKLSEYNISLIHWLLSMVNNLVFFKIIIILYFWPCSTPIIIFLWLNIPCLNYLCRKIWFAYNFVHQPGKNFKKILTLRNGPKTFS